MSSTLTSVIQSNIYFGYAQLANVMGKPYQQFRPQSALNPTGPACFVQNLNAVFDARPDFKMQGVPIVGKTAWFVSIDGTQTQVGDYLVRSPDRGVPGDTHTYFISSQISMEPIGATRCNGIISVLRPTGNTGFGAQPYGGDIDGNETVIMTGWPASILQGTKGEKGDSVLPGDVRMPWYAMQFPYYNFGITQVEAGDVINDDLGRRYKVSSCELTDSGWRLTAILAVT